MKTFIVILTLFFLTTLLSCKKENVKVNPNDVLVYSSQWACSNTQNRLDQYNAIKLPYTFKEIWKNYSQEPDSVNFYEMWDKAHSIGVNDITFPLVDVKGVILINPSAEEVLKNL